jgi:hypothetical protein
MELKVCRGVTKGWLRGIAARIFDRAAAGANLVRFLPFEPGPETLELSLVEV